MRKEIYNEEISYYRATRPFQVILYEDGICQVEVDGKKTEVPWYKNDNGKPWIPGKRQTFISLIKDAVREGDYDNLF